MLQGVLHQQGMSRSAPLRLRPLAAGLVLAAASSCSATRPQIITSPDQPPALQQEANASDGRPVPRVLRGLGLSAGQRGELRRLREKLKPRLAPMGDAAEEYALALAKVARQCDPDGKALEDAGSWAVVVGQDVRGAALDAIDGVHAILTPAQREALSRRLLGKEEQRDDEERTDEDARSLGGKLDLSVGQLMSLLVRAQLLRSALEERTDPWRVQYRRALRAFPAEDFSIRDQAIAEVPAVAIATRFVRDAVRMLLPILEPDQCVALADLIEDEVRKSRERQR